MRPHPSSRRPCTSSLLLSLALCLLLAAAGAPSAARASTAPDIEEPVGVWPLVPEPVVLERFAPPDKPWGPGHRGVDLLGRTGQWVRAARPGTIGYAGRLAGRGVVTVLHADGTRTTYEPVRATVEAGAQVPQGGAIGRLELVGSHCFPRACLHWGWRRGEVYLDPLDLVGAGPVRLLPLWRDYTERRD